MEEAMISVYLRMSCIYIHPELVELLPLAVDWSAIILVINNQGQRHINATLDHAMQMRTLFSLTSTFLLSFPLQHRNDTPPTQILRALTLPEWNPLPPNLFALLTPRDNIPFKDPLYLKPTL